MGANGKAAVVKKYNSSEKRGVLLRKNHLMRSKSRKTINFSGKEIINRKVFGLIILILIYLKINF